MNAFDALMNAEPWGWRRSPRASGMDNLMPDETSLGMAAQDRYFGTPNFLGGPGGAAAFNFQKLNEAAEQSAALQGLRYGGISPSKFGNPSTRHLLNGSPFDTFFNKKVG